MAEPDVSKGVPTESLTAEWYNRAVAKIKAIADVKGSHPIVVDRKERTVVRIDRTQGFFATLSGSSSPYSFTEKYGSSGGGWTTGVRTGTTNAYEANGTSGLSGKTVWLEPGWPGDYRFQYVGAANPTGPCTWAVTVNGCYTIYSGVTVTVTQGAYSWTATTNGSGVATFANLPTGAATATTTPPNARFVASSATRTLSSGSQSSTINMAAATGYACAGTFGCNDPIPTTLSGTYYHYFPGDTEPTAIALTFGYTSPYWLSNWFDTGEAPPGLEYRVRLGFQSSGGGSWNVGRDSQYTDGTPIFTGDNAWGASLRTAASCSPFILDMITYTPDDVIINGSLYVEE